jgi:hypothetical protein
MNFTDKLSSAAEEKFPFKPRGSDKNNFYWTGMCGAFIAGGNKALELLAEKQDGFAPRVYLETHDVNEAVRLLDLGESTTAHILLYPHKDCLPDLTHYIPLEESNSLRAKDLLRVRELEYCLEWYIAEAKRGNWLTSTARDKFIKALEKKNG